MEWERSSTDQLEHRLVEDEQLISRLRAEQTRLLEELDRRQVPFADGARSLSEWATARLDVGPETARNLVRTMRRLQDRPGLRERLSSGTVSFDRAEALSRIDSEGDLLLHLDVSGVRREAARRAGVSRIEEQRAAADRYLVIQPSLDESWWRLWGGLDGPSGALVDKVLTDKGDELPSFPDGSRGDVSWRKATALVELATGSEPPPSQVTVFVDAQHPTPPRGLAGIALEAGPSVGTETLTRILCDARTEVIAKTTDGRFMEYGRQKRTAPPALRRAVIFRDGNACVADGCASRYRLEIHHMIPWAQGGGTNASDLITLCWFHHHVVVHERGYQIYRHPAHGRIRFRPPPDDRST